MNTMSSVYDETVVSQVRVPYTPEAIERIISEYVTVLGYNIGADYSITFIIDSDEKTALRPAIRALKNTRFKKPVRIRTDGKSQIILELVAFG